MDQAEKWLVRHAFLFSTRASADSAITDILKTGWDRARIGVFTGAKGEEALAAGDTTDQAGATGAGLGAAVGGFGALLADLGILAFPGVGPVLGIGPVAATLTGAIAGVSLGGVAGALTGLGVSETQAILAEDHLREGKTIVLLSGDVGLSASTAIMRHGGVSI